MPKLRAAIVARMTGGFALAASSRRGGTAARSRCSS